MQIDIIIDTVEFHKPVRPNVEWQGKELSKMSSFMEYGEGYHNS